MVWKQAKAKSSPEQIELSISLGVIIFCWIINGIYVTAATLETQYFFEVYQKSRKVHFVPKKKPTIIAHGPYNMEFI